MRVTFVRFTHYLRCINYYRQFCTEDYIQYLIKNKRKIRLDSEKSTRQLTFLQHTDWLNRNAMHGRSKCGQRRSTSRRHSTPSLTNLFGRHSNLATSITSTSVSWERYSESRRLRCRQTKRVTFSTFRKDPERIQVRRSDVQSAVQHSASILFEGRNTTLIKDKRNGYLPESSCSRLSHDFEICRWRDTFYNFQRIDTENDVWFQESIRESDTQYSARQDEDSRQSEHRQFEHKKAYRKRWHEHRNIDKKRKRKIFGSENIVLT